MPFAAGVYSLPAGNPVITATTISTSWCNTTMNDIGSALSTCVLKDGTQVLTANIPMGGFKLTGLAAGTATGNSLRYEQLFSAAAVNLLGGINSVKTTVASAAAPDIWTSTGNLIDYTGTATATSFAAAPQAGAQRTLVCAGAAIFTAGANMLIQGYASGANYTAAAGDIVTVAAITTTQFRLTIQLATGTAVIAPAPITASLGGDVALNNTANYFDGPSIAQGTVGTWLVSGTVTVQDTAGAAQIDAKLWDGTTVIASTIGTIASINQRVALALSGRLASPAGNLRISVKDVTSTSGVIIFNTTGNSKDSTITAVRVA